jgi:hypothetical protein
MDWTIPVEASRIQILPSTVERTKKEGGDVDVVPRVVVPSAANVKEDEEASAGSPVAVPEEEDARMTLKAVTTSVSRCRYHPLPLFFLLFLLRDIVSLDRGGLRLGFPVCSIMVPFNQNCFICSGRVQLCLSYSVFMLVWIDWTLYLKCILLMEEVMDTWSWLQLNLEITTRTVKFTMVEQ